jgi:hypothetical protein
MSYKEFVREYNREYRKVALSRLPFMLGLLALLVLFF